MYRIRFHGRGGQGMKTASRIVGRAFFLAGFEVQDAPRYGAERRGAPMFAYVRAARADIHERGVIDRPDLVAVADDTLVQIPAAGVLTGVARHTVMLIVSRTSADNWRHRLNLQGPLLTLPPESESEDALERHYVGAMCAGGAARLVGMLSREVLEQAVRSELEALGEVAVRLNLETALQAFDLVTEHAGTVTQSEPPSAERYTPPDWVDLGFEDARASAPAIHAGTTSVEVRTGLWRTMRPVIELDRCRHCWWVCASLCPDSAIAVNENGDPEIDYDHCKGCMICVAQCPPHAIQAIPEQVAQAAEGERV